MNLDQLKRELARLERASAQAAEKRASLPPGSSRARVTSANAKWMRLAEARDRVRKQIEETEQCGN